MKAEGNGEPHVAVRPMRHLSLCAGYGGLDLGLKLALGECGVRTVCYVEREASAAATLVARMEDSALDQAPVWDCLETFAGAAWRGAVDIVSAGFPCQPWSTAGKREGTDDARWLWPSVFRVAVDVGAPFVFLENVPGLVTGHGLEYVLSDLASAGFDAEWGYFSAGEVGASHRRRRVFILAYCEDPDWRDGEPGEQGDAGRRRGEPATCGADMADAAECRGQRLRIPARSRDEGPRTTHADGQGAGMGDAEVCAMEGGGPAGEQEPYAYAGQVLSGCASDRVFPRHPRAIHSHMRQLRGETLGRVPERSVPYLREAGERGSDLSVFPPGPADRDGWMRVLADQPNLAPALAQSAVRGVADGCPGRVDRLGMLGNGVLPLQAAYAFHVLAARIGNGNNVNHDDHNEHNGRHKMGGTAKENRATCLGLLLHPLLRRRRLRRDRCGRCGEEEP